MWRQLVAISALVAPSSGVIIQSWPKWKTSYNTAINGKTVSQVKVINQHIEGSTAPTDSGEQDLWTWFSNVHAGTEKTAAQSLMQETFVTLGGDTSVLADFKTTVGTSITGAANIDKSYTLYREITSATKLGHSDANYEKHQMYHSMSAEQQKLAKAALLLSLDKQWDAKWKGVTDFKTDYKTRTGIIAKIMDAQGSTAPTNTVGGKEFYTAYTAAVKHSDTEAVSFFDRKMAEKLRAGKD